MAITTLIPSKAPNLPIAPIDYEQRYVDQLTNALRLYFNQIDNITQNIIIPQSGTTADRPTDRLQVGQYYFDTTIGRPIWYNGTDWINAAGTVV
jgi:hypothetical protein